MNLLQKTITSITVPDAALARRVTAALCTRSGMPTHRPAEGSPSARLPVRRVVP